MSARFNKPPGWPQPPTGWEPDRDWAPDPSWPAPPEGWRLWIIDTVPQWPTSAATAPIPSIPQNQNPPIPPTTPTPADPPAPPVVPSLTSTVFGIGTPADRPTSDSGPTSARMISWGALGVVLLAVSGVTVGSLATAPATSPASPLLRSAQTAEPPTATSPTSTSTSSAAPTSSAPASSIPGAGDPIEQVLARAGAGTALAGLADLNVRQRGPSTGYARSRFGSALRDTDGNGCDQRNDVLRRDLTRKTVATNGCAVLSGTLSDPYSGRKVTFKRTPGGQAKVRIDHIVPLGDAWMKGARAWSAAKRSEFATDPLNLLAVGASVITGKRASDAVRWLPEAADYRCPYVARQVAVKRKYEIWVTPAERTTIAGILAGCAGQKLPKAGTIELGEAPPTDSKPVRPQRPTTKKAKPQPPRPRPATPTS
jgi:hypothetical protein